MGKIDFDHLAELLMFKLSEKEYQAIEDDFALLESQLALLEKIDTDNIEPMVYPFEYETTYLREDKVSDIMAIEDVLKNAKTVKDDLLVVAKVANR